MSELIHDGKYVELIYTVTDSISGNVLTTVRWATFMDTMKF
jgi:hypothetical protein